MADYESESSMSDDELGQSTDVMLGYASKEPTSDIVSHLGGDPQWPTPTQPASFAHSRCSNCTNPMPLLLQLNADLADRFPTHERRLYLWACRAKRCRRKPGCVRALRAVKVHDVPGAQDREKADSRTTKKEDVPKQDFGSALFRGPGLADGGAPSGNPFASPSSAQVPSTNPFTMAPAPASTLAAKAPQNSLPNGEENLSSTFAQKARITDAASDTLPHPPNNSNGTIGAVKWEDWPTDPSAHANSYPNQHLDAEPEYLPLPDPARASKEHHSAFMDVDQSAEASSAKASTSKEKELPDDLIDKTFQHFADTLAQNPEQVLRYHFAGKPLLYRRGDSVGQLFASQHDDPSPRDRSITTVAASGNAPGAPRCPKCGAARVFECQLVPGMIAALEEEEDGPTLLEVGMDWGTIIVASCEQDCVDSTVKVGETGWTEEWVGVQWEEVVDRSGGKASSA